MRNLHILGDENGYYESDFVVREGDDLHYLGNFIGKSARLEYLSLSNMPLNDSFRDGLTANKSIKELSIHRDLGEEGVQGLAPLFRNTNTLTTLEFSANFSCESIKSFALLLSQCQIISLKRISFEECEQICDDEYTEIARALTMQPQLEVLDLSTLYGEEEYNDSLMGHITLGDTMKHWKSPCLKKLEIDCCHVDDDGMIALAEGMANCSNLESLNLAGNDTITERGLKALSSLFQSKKFLRSIDLSCMNIVDDGMAVLALGLASLKSLKKLDLSHNNIGDVGLEALATVRPDFSHLEDLALSNNAGFTAVGLKSLSSVLLTVSGLKYLRLYRNSIDDEGLHAFTTAMRGQCTIDSLNLSNNAISSGVRSLAAMTTLRRLHIKINKIGDTDEALEALVETIESLCNLEHLSLSRVESSEVSILSPIFQYEKSSLQELDLSEMRLKDSGAIALANGLRCNKSLRIVTFDRMSLTDMGWRAFERLLCDTSSVNQTYSSNHTLKIIGKSRYQDGYPASIKALLDLNDQKRQGVNVPICKILMSHADFDMTPLLQWKLKLLPFVIKWFERARSIRLSEPRATLECRKLSAMYQFVVGASHFVVEGYAHSNKQTITVSSSRKRKIDQCDEE